MAAKGRIYIRASYDGQDVEGLTLSDFEVSLKKVSKTNGTVVTVLDKVTMDFEVGWGIYGKLYDSPDYLNYDYFSKVEYKGASPLDYIAWLGGPDDADVSSRTALGAGAIQWTYTLLDQETGQPLPDADVWITTDQAGHNVIASGKTDQFGNVRFYLDQGNVYVWKQKSGYNFTNPEMKTVS